MDALTQLQESFSIPGVLAFARHGALVCAQVHAPAAEATIYLQGAHLAHWQPSGHDPVLFLSPESQFADGKAIRGGVPISFPWFATRSGGEPGPSHGFARTAPWELSFAALAGDAVHMALTMGPGEESRRYGYDHFRLVYELRIGAVLQLRLSVFNQGDASLQFEEALHTYFAVGDVREASTAGLEATPFLDKTLGTREMPAAGTPLVLSGVTDRVYEGSVTDCVITDRAGRRRITNGKMNSSTTVVWNPWQAIADLGDDAWPHMLCVETANTGPDAVTLLPGTAHTMQAVIEAVHAAQEGEG